MFCAFCRREMAYIHGHAACVNSGCPMYGVNQAECCDGETAEAAPVRTAEVAAVPDGVGVKGAARAPVSRMSGSIDPRDRPKYARWEHERRFLVRAENARFLTDKPRSRLIEDRYLSCGRLRLRRLTDSDTGAVTYKLTKKYPSGSDLSQPIVTVLLSSAEHAALGALAGADLRKRRFHDDVLGRVFGIDVFEATLAGLVLCSVETDTLEELKRVALPRYAGPDVTHDPFFTGGRLCVATAREIERALASAFPAPA